MTHFVLIMVIIFLSAIIQGITSFGFALVAVPLLNLLLPLQVLVPVLIVYGVILDIVLLIPIYKNLDLKGMGYLIGAGVLGVPLGTYLLIILNESVLRAGIGVIVIISAFALYSGYHIQVKNEKLGNMIAGFTSGLLNGSLTMSGPPVIIFYSNQQLEKQVFRANLAFYFLLTNIITVPVLFWGGLVTPEVIHYTFILTPSLIIGALGVLIGSKMGSSMSGALFNRLTLVLFFIMGCMSIIGAF
ncbi:MAG: sulfite exporter TauE/SafE family protein [Bacillota bacterium]|nr:sulfite exporter TauE/SafE family protein [Bacillota bacterium]